MINIYWNNLKNFTLTLTQSHKHNTFSRYMFPVILLALILSIKFALNTYFHHDVSEHLLTLVVILSAWYGGLGPGTLATILAGIANDYFFLPTHIPFLFFDNIVTTIIFFCVGISLSILIEAKHQADRQKDIFIGMVSHELKNPLTTIKSYTQLLLNAGEKQINKTQQTYLSRIDIQANNIIEMITDLLDLSRMESGSLSYTNEYITLSTLIKETLIEQQMLTKTHKILLKGKTTKKLYGDKQRIRQVLINIITNAIKYSPHAKKVIVHIKNTYSGIEISVKDFGIGIPKEQVSHVFDNFFRASNAMKDKIQGSGLGLNIALQIVKRHHGKIWVTSVYGKGSTFYIYFPARS